MPILNIAAPAKINLALSVACPPQDGFHQLDSVFQQIDLCDELTFNTPSASDVLAASGGLATQAGTPVYVECTLGGLDPKDNLAFRAVDLFEQELGRRLTSADEGIAIRILKHIPAGAGMGGGSSDAAATLKFCAWLAGEDAQGPQCLKVARALGSDVAFFLQGGAALMAGRGDELVRPLPPLPLAFVLMGEAEPSPTARIYADFDANPAPGLDVEALAQAMEGMTASAGLAQRREVAALCGNNLQPAVLEAFPRIRQRLDFALGQDDVLNALVTGSGSTSFAICPDQASANRFALKVAQLCDWTMVSVPR